ncbi:MAG: MBL fold metallo-hydrolase [Candidatus Hodarchaeales archaeon]|jgi:phosphoribosyl 1,2-cyclic phosphodiesterase
MLKVCVLASNSKGNATFLRIDEERYLIDAGISAKRIERMLLDIDEKLEEINGVIITHEHVDHTSGIKTLSQTYQLKFWLPYETYNKISKKTGNFDAEFIEIGEDFQIGKKMIIIPYEIPHDAVDPIAFLVKTTKGDPVVGYILDCGSLNSFLIDGFRKVQILIIESNYSFDLLLQSDYPQFLKHRILSSKGHLSNWDVAQFIIKTKPKIVVLSHLSENNNNPETALAEIQDILLRSIDDFVLPFIVIVPPKGRSAIINTLVHL